MQDKLYFWKDQVFADVNDISHRKIACNKKYLNVTRYNYFAGRFWRYSWNIMARWYCRRWRQDRKLWGRRRWRWMWYVTLPVCNDFSLVLFSDSARTHKDRFKRKRFCYFWVFLLIETFAEEKSVSDGFRAVLFNFTCTLTKQIYS